jgi:ABC-type glycerol-3-phosphate transport system substrate-binding protein
MPVGARYKEAAAHLLAWMASPEILAEAAYAHAMLPSSRTAARDPRFQQVPNYDLFVDLLAHPNARHMAVWPLNSELNEALGQVEETLFQQGGDPVRLLNKAQAGLAPKFEEGRPHQERP